jgi:hypothetical protein
MITRTSRMTVAQVGQKRQVAMANLKLWIINFEQTPTLNAAEAVSHYANELQAWQKVLLTMETMANGTVA